jgi:DNA mismatch repair ATPase MutS
MIITGPNASGKTTTLKSILINVIITQQFGCGFYDNANFEIFDFVHCYLNIPDTSGRDSLFQAECRRCKEILDTIKENDSSKTHLCVFDELYSGTNPDEAVMSSLAFMRFLIKHKNIKCILTTHFIKVCTELEEHKSITNFHMHTKEIEIETEDKDKKQIDFKYTYKLEKGISSVKGGIKVLRDMNYPDEILNDSIRSLNK